MTKANDPDVLILTSLAGGQKHGYALTKDIEKFAGVSLGPGTLYVAISRLEDRGLIQAVGADDRRRPYRLTAAGKTSLQAAVSNMERVAREGARRLKARARITGSPA